MFNYLSFVFNGSRAAYRIASQSKKAGNAYDRILVTQYSPVTMSIPAIILKKQLNLPMVLFCFDLWPESIVSVGLKNHGFFYNAIKLISRYIYNQSDHIITSSRHFDKYLREKLGYRGPITHIPMYAEDLFSGASSHSSFDVCNFVFAGNVGKMQGIETILKAVYELKSDLMLSKKQLPIPIIIHIVGDGSAYESSIAYAKELEILISDSEAVNANGSGHKIGVVFHGRHPLESMPRFYNIAAAMLITLKKDSVISSTLPNKMQTYMAAGKPIVAAIDGEASRVIREADCGLVCEAEDYHSLSENLYQFACLYCGKDADPSSVNRYGQNSRSYYEEFFTSRNFIKSLLQVLR